jgi:hypothetical protein
MSSSSTDGAVQVDKKLVDGADEYLQLLDLVATTMHAMKTKA